ncbi:MAG: peptidase M15 [Croceicoccus sp.]|nr:peptidase M15 [Croceicoccus sp.]MAL26354.1 peptidase M15 [Croceicoccus sp.]
MRRPGSVSSLEDLGRVRLSENFFMRDMLYSEIANFYGIPNIPDDPDLAIAVGKRLCEELLEPIWDKLGRISVRSAYRSCSVNEAGIGKHACASNESNYAGHIWDRRDKDELSGATACIVVHSFIPYYERTGHWQALAWWLHDNLPQNGGLTFYPKLAAFNISWYEQPVRHIYSHIPPNRGWLTKAGMDNYEGSHEAEYQAWIDEAGVGR